MPAATRLAGGIDGRVPCRASTSRGIRVTRGQLATVAAMAMAGALAGLVFVAVVDLLGRPADAPPVAGVTAVPARASMTPRPAQTSMQTAVPSRPPPPSVIPTPTRTPFPAASTEIGGEEVALPSDLLPPLDDRDNDGLRDDAEIAAGTDPWEWDSDGGGEPDGSEVAAGRQPLDDADDVAEPGCVPEGASAFETPESSAEPERVLELEGLVPRQVADHRLEIGSMAGVPRSYGLFNYFWDGLLLCVGGEPDDLAHAIGVSLLASSDEGWGSAQYYTVFAIRVAGVSGHDLAATHVAEMIRQGHGRTIAAPRTLAGKEYLLLSNGGAVYATDAVMFWMVNITVLDSGLYVDEQVDFALVEATVPQLP
jgi:hypothetical protein